MWNFRGHQPFYDADIGGGGNEKIEIVYQGEVIDSVEVPAGLPEDVRVKIKQGMEKGTLYDKKMHSIAETERELLVQQTKMENVQTALDRARDDEDYRDGQFIPNLEAELGFELTKKEVKDALDFDGDSEVVSKLTSKIEKLEKRVEAGDQQSVLREIDITHKKLENQYDGKEGFPKYDREAVQKYIDDNKFIIPDIESNYEQAYYLANRDEIREADRNNAGIEEKNRKKFIKDNRSGSGDPGGIVKKVDMTGMTSDEYEAHLLEKAHASGENFYIDEND